MLQAYHTRIVAEDCSWSLLQTRYSDYVLKVFNDTSIELEFYSQNFGIFASQFHRISYEAKGRIINDTLTASWISYILWIAEQYKPLIQRNLNIDTTFGFLPPVIFALKNDVAVGVGQPLPILKKAAMEDIAMLEFEFKEWVKNKHGF